MARWTVFDGATAAALRQQRHLVHLEPGADALACALESAPAAALFPAPQGECLLVQIERLRRPVWTAAAENLASIAVQPAQPAEPEIQSSISGEAEISLATQESHREGGAPSRSAFSPQKSGEGPGPALPNSTFAPLEARDEAEASSLPSASGEGPLEGEEHGPALASRDAEAVGYQAGGFLGLSD